MPSPLQAFENATDRASEIAWWNRGLSKLNRIPGIQNAESFVYDELVDTKGPYLEFVAPPAISSQSAADLLNEHGYDDVLIDAIVSELFGGDRTGSLYQHQADLISAIQTDPHDNILAVPTATGKTESFFFPILNDCLATDAEGLKAIVIYPMKTLGVDQLNRFIRYLDQVNRQLSQDERVTIGIWDRDTPPAVGQRDFDMDVGANVRGLTCPRTGQDLRVSSDGTPGNDDWTYPWLKITREQIRDDVDILLTNPEALDYMFVSDNEDTRDILGQGPEKNLVQHIVFDEAHVWSGISGSSIGLLIRRLQRFFDAHDPQVSLVSATVDNPAELAATLTDTAETDINDIGFTARDFPVTGGTDFDRFSDCSLRDIVEALVLADLVDLDRATFCDRYPHLEGAVTTLQTIGLLTVSGTVEIVEQHRDWIRAPFRDALDRYQRETNGGDAVSLSEDELDSLTQQVIEHGDLSGGWFEFVRDEVPEVSTLASWFTEESSSAMGFLHHDELVDKVEDAGATQPADTLAAVLALGRAAGLVTAKYHVFAKPPRKVFWCRTCDQVMRGRSCPDGHDTVEFQFCRSCHHPYIEDGDGEDPGFQPVGHDDFNGTCPGCGTNRIRLTDITVPTSTLLSFMLTELCRSVPSNKTLVFSDSRATAESVSTEIVGTEYGLTAESLYVKQLLEQDGRADSRSLFFAVSNTLREQYWQPLRQNTPDDETDANDILVEMLNEIEPHARLPHCQHLREAALLTPAWIYEQDDPVTASVAHEVFNLFVSCYPPEFTKHTVEFDGYTRERLLAKLEKDTRFERHRLEQSIDTILQGLIDHNVLELATWDDVRRTILEADVDEATEDDVFDYIEGQIGVLESIDGYGDVGGGIFLAHSPAIETDLQLVPTVTFCEECYAVSPHPQTDEPPLEQCVQCGAPVDIHHRFRREDDGSLSLLGWADIDSGWDYPVDHWGHDVLAPLIPADGPPVSKDEVRAQELEFITVGIHKGDVPPTLRSAIEEGFRKSSPDVNLVSATPTMELGVDIGTLDSVAQVGMPPTLTNYVQRSGRTGRTRGSASLVATTVRGTHPVDAHYYDDLDRFFNTFEPVRVPSPLTFDEVVASHVVTEVIAYLARNHHSSNTFDDVYYANQPVDSVEEFVDQIEVNLDQLQTFISSDVEQRLRTHIEDVFGSRGLDLFEAVFQGNGSASFTQRAHQMCSRLRSFSDSTDLDDVRDGNNRLDAWLNQLGYLANYRDFGQQFPVEFEGSSEGISFQGDGRLYDFYPGEQNSRGAVMTLYGSTYLVSDVEGTSEPLQTVAICTNEDCSRPFESYSHTVSACPHCHASLDTISVHGVQAVTCRKAYQYEDLFSTSPIMTTHVAEHDETTARDAVLFGLDCEVTTGSYEVVDFIPAFERRHSMGTGEEIKRSEARLTSPDSVDDRYAPVGNQYTTQGLCLTFAKSDIADRLSTDDPNGEEIWPQIFVSLEQALTKAVTVITQSDQDDFRVKATATEDQLHVYVVDNREGGNGIASQVESHLPEVEDEVRHVVDCEYCGQYCENCLLIERTPATYLENDLLHRSQLETALTEP